MRGLVVLQLMEYLMAGGAGSVVLTISRGLKQRGLEPIVCGLKECPEKYSLVPHLERAGIAVRVLDHSGSAPPVLLWRLVRLVRQEGVRVIQGHLFAGNFWGRTAGRLAHVPAIIATEHNLADGKVEPRRYFAIDRLLSRHTDRIVAVCARVADSLVEQKGIPARKIATIPNAVCPEHFPDDGGLETRLELKISSDAPVVGFVGRFFPEKNLFHFLQALVRVRASSPAMVGLLVGDGPLFEETQAQAETLGLARSLRFTGFREDISRLLAAMDVFVLPSATEGLSMTLLEAMAAGKPAVVSTVGGSQEAVVDGVTGFTVSPGDPDRLGEAIARLLAEPESRRRMGEAARQRVAREFSSERQVEQLAALYESILREKGILGRSSV